MRKYKTLQILGLSGMLTSPFMLIDLWINGLYGRLQYTGLEALFSFIFLSGWMCMLTGLKMLRAAGEDWLGRTVLGLQIILFACAAWHSV